MSELKLNQIANLTSIEPILSDPNLLNIQPVRTGSFDEHLQRAQTPGAADAGGGPDPAEAHSPPPPAADEPPPTDDRAADQDASDIREEDTPTNDSEAETDARRDEQTDSAEAAAQVHVEREANDQTDKDGRKTLVSADDLAGSRPDKEAGPQHTGASPQAEDPGIQGEALPETPANSTDAPEHPAAAENPITDLPPQLLDQSAGQETDQAGQMVVDPTVDQTGPEAQAAGQQQASAQQIPEADASEPEAPGPVDRETGKANTRTNRTVQQTPGRSGRSAARTNTAATPQADAQTISSEPGAPVTDPKVDTGDAAAKPVPGGSHDSQPNAPMEVSSNQAPRPSSPHQPPKAAGPGRLDRVRFVQRVARAFHTMGDRSGSVRLRLSPPELGSLRLEISVHKGVMTARAEAETSAAKNLLLDNLPALRDRLAQQDIKVEHFDVGLMDRSPDGLPNQTANHAESRERGRSNSAEGASLDGEQETNTIADPGAASRPGEGTQLNVVV